jgi:uncharacterized membrane protein HdeD (DUF308 family)
MTNNPLAAVAEAIWWVVLLRGILAVIFGIIALAAPGAALTGIVVVFGIYAIIDGVAAVVHAVRIRTPGSGWGWLLFQGIVSIVAGFIALVSPVIVGVIGGVFALLTIAIYAVVHGGLGIQSAAGMREGRNRTIGIVSGVLTLLFGVLLVFLTLVTPGATVLSLIWIVGIYAIVFGIMFIIAAVQVRRGAGSVLGGQETSKPGA